MSYTWTDVFMNELTVEDNLYCTDEELYLQNQMFSGSGNSCDFQQSPGSNFTYFYVNNITGETSPNGRRAILAGLPMNGGNPYAIFTSAYGGFNGYTIWQGDPDQTHVAFTNQANQIGWNYSSTEGGQAGGSRFEARTSMGTNIPIFKLEDASWMDTYLNSTDDLIRHQALTHAVNYKSSEYDPFESEYHWIYNNTGQCAINDGTYSGNPTQWHSLKLMSNKMPALWCDPDTFELHLVTDEVIKSYHLAAPGYVLDDIPESSWPEGLAYSGPFYGNMNVWYQNGMQFPDNGSYMYGIYLNTDIPIFASEAEAIEAVQTGDYTKAGNYGDITGGDYYIPPSIGEDLIATLFGNGPATCPFAKLLICRKETLNQLANVLFTSDDTILGNLKKGLEMYGANPIDCIIDLKAWPINLTNVFHNISDRSSIFLGGYEAQVTTAAKEVIGFSNADVVNCGGGVIKPIFKNFRDFEPYTELNIFLPGGIGWKKLSIGEYYNKTLSVKYYLDLYCGQCVAVVLADNVMQDYFIGDMGMSMPVRGANFAQYAQGVMRTVTQPIIGAAGGAMTGGAVGAIAGLATGATSGAIDLMTKPKPMSQQTQKGNFSSGINFFMPQDVLLRFDIKKMKEPSALQTLYGRPSASSGKLSNFTGFLRCDVTRMNTEGMLDEEIDLIKSLLKEGIYI